ncbi:hypothetical protein GmRootV213_50130 (plasmid) [Variovorax sp. V213]|uniref:DDE-type integrase/transposase/recombinase n=1 Tax=Variovorax sp. V213 TaxID=3065955 RepID=UPI0034E88790
MVWVADFTYIRIASGFCYLAAILDARSRKVVGYAISRNIDTTLALAALRSAVQDRQPPAGCIFHTDRGSQGGFNRSSQHWVPKAVQDHIALASEWQARGVKFDAALFDGGPDELRTVLQLLAHREDPIVCLRRFSGHTQELPVEALLIARAV